MQRAMSILWVRRHSGSSIVRKECGMRGWMGWKGWCPPFVWAWHLGHMMKDGLLGGLGEPRPATTAATTYSSRRQQNHMYVFLHEYIQRQQVDLMYLAVLWCIRKRGADGAVDCEGVPWSKNPKCFQCQSASCCHFARQRKTLLRTKRRLEVIPQISISLSLSLNKPSGDYSTRRSFIAVHLDRQVSRQYTRTCRSSQSYTGVDLVLLHRNFGNGTRQRDKATFHTHTHTYHHSSL